MRKFAGPDVFHGIFYQMLKELTPVVYDPFQKVEEEHPNHTCKASIVLIPKPDKE